MRARVAIADLGESSEHATSPAAGKCDWRYGACAYVHSASCVGSPWGGRTGTREPGTPLHGGVALPGPVCLQGTGVCARGLNGPVRARPVGLSLGRGDTPHNPTALGRQSPTPLGEGDRRSVFASLGADGVAKWDAGLALPTAGVRLARSPALGHVHGPIDGSDAEARLGPCVGAVHPTHAEVRPALNGQGPWALGGICVRNFGAPGMSTGVSGGGMAAPPGLRAEVAAGLYPGFSSANSASAGHGPCAQGTRGISGGAVSLKGDTRKEGASSRALLWADGGCPLQRQLRLRRAELRREEAAARMQAAARGFLARREVARRRNPPDSPLTGVTYIDGSPVFRPGWGYSPLSPNGECGCGVPGRVGCACEWCGALVDSVPSSPLEEPVVLAPKSTGPAPMAGDSPAAEPAPLARGSPSEIRLASPEAEPALLAHGSPDEAHPASLETEPALLAHGSPLVLGGTSAASLAAQNSPAGLVPCAPGSPWLVAPYSHVEEPRLKRARADGPSGV